MKQLSYLGAAGLVLGVAATAHAHISLDDASTHKSRYEDGGDTKRAPCGVPLGPSRVNVYTYEPGETIAVSVIEFIPHPSYFRIAFDDDGDDDFMDPRWIVPIDPVGRGGCPLDAVDQCRMGVQATDGDFYNTPGVLMDNLDPHVASASAGTYTWQVTLPDVECDNCTLQIIQVMEDPALGFHGPFNTMNGDDNDVYHQCIDLVLKRSGSGPGGMDAGAGGMFGAGGVLGIGGMDAAGGAPAGLGAGGVEFAGSGGLNPTGGVPGSAGGQPGQPAFGGAPANGAGGGAAAEGFAAPSPSSDDGGGCAITRTRGGASRHASFALSYALVAAWRGRRRHRSGR